MQPHDSSRFRSPRPRQPSSSPPGWDVGGAAPAPAGLDPELPFAESRVVIAAPALLIDARFRDVPLASRLLRADDTRKFTVGAARGADAPVNPAYLPAAPEGVGHVLVEPLPGGFALNLAPAMRAELLTPVQVLPLRPDFGRAEAPLVLPPDACLRVSCGEVAFDVFAAEPAAAIPPPTFAAVLRETGRYQLGVALVFAALLLIVRAVPEDASALAGDDLQRLRRLDSFITIPLDINSPEVDSAMASKTPGGGGAQAAKGTEGKAGDRKAKPIEGRRSIAGKVDPKDAQEAAGEIRKNPMLVALDGAMTGSAAEVFKNQSALGPEAETFLGAMEARTIASSFGLGGLGSVGTGAGGGGTGEHTYGLGGLGTLGKYGSGVGPASGPGTGYGVGAGKLRTHKTITPDVLPGVASVRGTLDKDIIRRIVRRHINEVKYCYDQALARQPKLDGRMVAQFTIAGSGQVLASVVASSTLGSPTVEMCVTKAIMRWQFPAPDKGGLAIVSYPFQFSPAGN
jgi:TonB family protein